MKEIIKTLIIASICLVLVVGSVIYHNFKIKSIQGDYKLQLKNIKEENNKKIEKEIEKAKNVGYIQGKNEALKIQIKNTIQTYENEIKNMEEKINTITKMINNFKEGIKNVNEILKNVNNNINSLDINFNTLYDVWSKSK